MRCQKLKHYSRPCFLFLLRDVKSRDLRRIIPRNYWRRGCDQNWRQFRLAVSTANRSWRFNNCQFCWQLALPIEIGVLATANFVGSWHWQLSIGSWQLCIGSWQLSIGS